MESVKTEEYPAVLSILPSVLFWIPCLRMTINVNKDYSSSCVMKEIDELENSITVYSQVSTNECHPVDTRCGHVK